MPFGSLWTPGSHLGDLGPHFGVFGLTLEAFGLVLGALGLHLEAPWHLLGLILGYNDSILGHLGCLNSAKIPSGCHWGGIAKTL